MHQLVSWSTSSKKLSGRCPRRSVLPDCTNFCPAHGSRRARSDFGRKEAVTVFNEERLATVRSAFGGWLVVSSGPARWARPVGAFSAVWLRDRPPLAPDRVCSPRRGVSPRCFPSACGCGPWYGQYLDTSGPGAPLFARNRSPRSIPGFLFQHADRVPPVSVPSCLASLGLIFAAFRGRSDSVNMGMSSL